MKQGVLSNIIFLVALNLLIKPFWIFGIERTVQNQVGPDVYGNYFALFNFVFLFQILLDLGINSHHNRSVSQDISYLHKHFYTTLALRILLSILFAGLVLGAAVVFQYSPSEIKLIGILVLAQFFASNLLFLRSNLGALQWFKRDSLLSISDRLLLILLVGSLLLGWISGPVTIERFALLQVLSYGLAFVLGFVLLIPALRAVPISIDSKLFKGIIKKSIPFASVIFMMGLYNRMDAVMIERMLPIEIADTEAGIYAAAYRLLDAANQIGLLSGTILYPVFSNLIAKKENISSLLRQSGVSLLLISCIVSVMCFSYRFEIMDWLYWESTAYYGDLFGILIFAFIGLALSYVYGSYLAASGRLSLLNKITLGGVILNLILNLLLIPAFDAMGAAIATVITQIGIGLAFLYFSATQKPNISSSEIIEPALPKKERPQQITTEADNNKEQKPKSFVPLLYLDSLRLVLLGAVAYLLLYYLSPISTIDWRIEFVLIAGFLFLFALFLWRDLIPNRLDQLINKK